MQRLAVGALILLPLLSIPFQEELRAASDSTPPLSPTNLTGGGGQCPDSKSLPNFPTEMQKSTSWCWAATATMAMHSRGSIEEQCFVVDAVRQNQLGIYTPSTCCIASPDTTVGCGDVLSYSWRALDEFGMKYDAVGESKFGWPELRKQICSDGPIIYGEDYWNGAGHEYVILGFIENKRIMEKSVVIYDPLDPPTEYREKSFEGWLRLPTNGQDPDRSSVEYYINIRK